MPTPLPSQRLLFLAAVAAIYLGLFFWMDGLRFPLQWDENHFWETSLAFSRSAVPSLDLLRSYDELNTPLPFFIYGAIERYVGNGLFVGRLLNLLLALAITLAIGLPARRRGSRALLAAAGLLLFPYFLYYSALLYTDTIAAALVLLGVALHLRDRPVWAGLVFVLAIAARQYMVAFPVALAAHELIQQWQGRHRHPARWLAPSLAALTILFWMALFGGPAPAAAMAERPIAPAQEQWLSLAPATSLYFLACVGLYFVLPEFVLFRRWRSLPPASTLLTRRNLAIALVPAVALLLFPPFVAHGLLSKAARFLSLDALKLLLFYGLILLACFRFARPNLAFWLVLTNALVMLRAFPWDKYVMPLLIVLWYLKATGHLDAEEATSEDDTDVRTPAVLAD